MEVQSMFKKILKKFIMTSTIIFIALCLTGPLSLAKELDDIRAAIATQEGKVDCRRDINLTFA